MRLEKARKFYQYQSSVVSRQPGKATRFEQDSAGLNRRYFEVSREPEVNEAADTVDVLTTDDQRLKTKRLLKNHCQSTVAVW
jgi:hypothetical protein